MSAEDFVSFKVFPVDDKEDVYVLRGKCVEMVMKYGFMWHQDRFVLDVNEDFLTGKMNIGDNIEDEWFLISLLYKFTEQFKVIVQVNDQDGEVLLIEAAENLPKWAQEPELAENRVYIYQNNLHLIPVAQSPAELTPIPCGKPEIKDAIQTVLKHSQVTLANEKVQDSIKKRLKSYPEDFSELMHFTHVIVPENLRPILKHSELIPEAVRLFYARDPIDLKVCRIMKNFNPKSQKLVKTGVKMTKCLYAMLNKQNFTPDSKAGWPILDKNDPDNKALNLGAKIACGFEILAHCKTHEEDLKTAFIQSLKNKGYFQGELTGSQKYNQLYLKALDHFEKDKDLEKDVKTPGMKLLELLKSDLKISDKEELEPEDDDSWLDLQPDSFDQMLKAHFKLNEDVELKSSQEIPTEVKNFLKAVSDMKGVEEKEQDEDGINFNPDELENAFKKILGMENNDSSDEDSDIDLDQDLDDNEMSDYFAQMSHELKDTKVTEDENDEDWSKPLSVDAKLLSNLMESYRGQNGLPGPASTLLNPLGFNLD